ncbi:patatin-like phospholipase family protein [Streptomyces sp. NPDC004266]|uniref:patatin-like phospholipase family protein n=1 Tax=Streptomyces sp. NPDC004266 TaxID=3364693 RepID=UPI0036CA171F
MDTADPHAQQALLAVRRELIGSDAWPERRLLMTAVDAVSGGPVVWDRDSGLPLAHAVAASSAFPGTAPPIAVGDRHHMDGALRGGATRTWPGAPARSSSSNRRPVSSRGSRTDRRRSSRASRPCSPLLRTRPRSVPSAPTRAASRHGPLPSRRDSRRPLTSTSGCSPSGAVREPSEPFRDG